MNTIKREPNQKEFDDLLNTSYPPIDVCGYTHPAAEVYGLVAPLRYYQEYVDYCKKNTIYECGVCGDEYDTEAEANLCCNEYYKVKKLLKN